MHYWEYKSILITNCHNKTVVQNLALRRTCTMRNECRLQQQARLQKSFSFVALLFTVYQGSTGMICEDYRRGYWVWIIASRLTISDEQTDWRLHRAAFDTKRLEKVFQASGWSRQHFKPRKQIACARTCLHPCALPLPDECPHSPKPSQAPPFKHHIT